MKAKENVLESRAKVKWPATVKFNDSTIEGVTTVVTRSGAYVCCGNPLRLNEVCKMIQKPSLKYEYEQEEK
jgi:hypothetical protein